ncbi:unnamed protein product [Linum tenue]|uniref:RNase H type-1 domain-containing protein n=1 Tax=Linum tenue TaxID=586396 RepID=A0AAV0Q0Q4_9ROSI|nr:unnamed protein product [Linum tenue]
MNLVIEVDSLGLVSKIQAAEVINSEIGVICRSIRRLLEESGTGTWQHVGRDGNNAAHIMAHTETRWNECIVWMDNPPFFLVDQLQLDNVTANTG